MQLKLSDLEVDILRKLVVRLELAGMIREGPNGIAVTLTGRSLAREQPADSTANLAAPDVKVSRDRRGRRMPFQRKSIF